MSTPFDIPGTLFPVMATAGAVTTNAGKTWDNISLKEVQMVYIHIILAQAVGHATAFTPLVGTLVATAATALPESVEIWYGNTSTTSVALAKQTDAKSFTVDVGVTGVVQILFKIDPSVLSATGTANVTLGGTTANSGQATNLHTVTYWILPRYQNAPASNTATRFITD